MPCASQPVLEGDELLMYDPEDAEEEAEEGMAAGAAPTTEAPAHFST